MKNEVNIKHELTPEKKKEIILYCNYVLENYVNNEFKKLYKHDIPYLLELFYTEATRKYFEEGNFELFILEINAACELIDQKNKLFYLFKNGEIDLVGIDRNLFYFGSKNEVL